MKRTLEGLALSLVLLLPEARSMAQKIESMKLVAQQTGWAESGNHLYWTADGGAHWNDIIPRLASDENLVGVFFLNESTGWVLAGRQGGTAVSDRFDRRCRTNVALDKYSFAMAAVRRRLCRRWHHLFPGSATRLAQP